MNDHRKQIIQNYVARPEDELWSELGRLLREGGYTVTYARFGFKTDMTPPEVSANEAKLWFNFSRQKIYHTICVEFDYCRKKRTFNLDTRIELITAVAALFTGLVGQFAAAAILAIILVRQRLDAFCGCDTAKPYFLQAQRAPEGSEQQIQLYKQAIVRDPFYAKAYYNLGYLYQLNNDPDRATSYYKDAIRLDPDDWYALNNLGYLWLRLDRNLDEAFGYAQKAFEKQPENLTVIHTYGLGLLKTGHPGDAIPHLKRVVSEQETLEWMYHLAQAYSKSGNTEKALEVCKEMSLRDLPMEYRSKVNECIATNGRLCL